MSTSNKNNTNTTLLSWVKFLVLMVLAGAFGNALRMVTQGFAGDINAMGDAMLQWFSHWLVPLQWICFAVPAAVCLWLYLWARKCAGELEAKGGDQEPLRQQADLLLSWGLTLSNSSLILGYGIFGAGFVAIMGRGQNLIGTLPPLFALMAFFTIYQVIAVNQMKRLNPEKNGDPLSARFTRQWMGSSDEAERLMVYQSAYQSYKITSTTLAAVWILTVLTGVTFGTGAYPVALVSFLWLVQSLSYQLHAIKLSKGKKLKS